VENFEMGKMQNSLTLCVITLLLLSCRDDFTVDPDPDPTNGSAILLNSSFELGGSSTLQGWDASNEQLTTFLQDTPPDGGEWCLSISSTPGPAAFIEALFPASSGTRGYKISVWGKYLRTQGTISIIQRSLNNTTIRSSLSVQDTVWTAYVLIDTLTTASGDSVGVRLSGGITEISTGTVAYDICLFERL